MQTGHISKLFQEKKYGKIQTQNGEEAHFHEHCLWDTEFTQLKEGQEVEFEIQPSYNGFLAFEIRPRIGRKSPHKIDLHLKFKKRQNQSAVNSQFKLFKS